MTHCPLILICDDDPVVHESLGLYLDAEKYEHISAYDGEEALRLVEERQPDLMILDLMMPRMSGIDVCRTIRLTKSLPSIKAVLRRFSEKAPEDSNIIRFPQLEINLSNYQVKACDKVVPCTPKEVEILHMLASHAGQVFSREQILSHVWGYDFFGDTRTVDTHIKRIRQKLPQEGVPWSLKTVYGVGYKFEVEG